MTFVGRVLQLNDLYLTFSQRSSQNGQDNHNKAGMTFDDIKATLRGGLDLVEVVKNNGKSFRCQMTKFDDPLQVVVLLAHAHVPLHGNG
jgi:hypothetical protein